MKTMLSIVVAGSLFGSAFTQSFGQDSGREAHRHEAHDDTAKIIVQLGVNDLEVRESAYRKLREQAMDSKEVRTALEDAKKTAKSLEVRWNARRILDEVERQSWRKAPKRPGFQFDIEDLGDLRGRLGSPEFRERMQELMKDRLEGLMDNDDVQERIEGLSERLRDALGDVELEFDFGGRDLNGMIEELQKARRGLKERLEGMLGEHGRNSEGMKQFNKMLREDASDGGRSISVQQSNDGLRVEVTQTVNGKKQTRVYEAENWEDFEKKHPGVKKELGIGQQGAIEFQFDGNRPREGRRPRRRARRVPREERIEEELHEEELHEEELHEEELQEERSEPAPRRPRLGVMITTIDELPEGIERDEAISVVEVMKGTLAAELGLKTDDILLTIDGEKIDGLQEGPKTITKALEKSKSPEIVVHRPGKGKVTLGGTKKVK